MKKAILFDADGTLLDAWDFVFDAIKYSLSSHGYPYPSDQKIREIMHKPLVEFYKALLPAVDPAKLVKAHGKFQEEKTHAIKPFPNARKTLKELKTAGHLLAVVSNRARVSLHQSLKGAKLLEFFDLVVSVEDVKNPKPHQEHVQVALKRLQVLPDHSYMVGDTQADILAGKNAGVKTVGVTYGFEGKSIKNHKPDFVIDDIKELLDILKLDLNMLLYR